MSLTIQLLVQYNNNAIKTLTGLHSPKGLEYTTENELNEWLLQLLVQMQELEELKPHKNLWINYNGSYCNNRVNQDRKTIEGKVQYITGMYKAQITTIEIINLIRDNL